MRNFVLKMSQSENFIPSYVEYVAEAVISNFLMKIIKGTVFNGLQKLSKRKNLSEKVVLDFERACGIVVHCCCWGIPQKISTK